MEETACTFVDANGIDSIFHILTLCPDSTQIQIDCSAVIANLSNVPAARVFLQQKTTYISLILLNMRKWVHEETVQTEMCAIISNLAQCEENGKRIVQSGGCERIRDAMMMHVDVEDLQVQGLNALAALVKIVKRQLTASLISSYIDCIHKSFEKWKESTSVCAAACNCIGMFAFVQLKMTRPVEHLILAAMQRFKECPKFQITACFALAHLTIAKGAESKMDLKAIESILAVMDAYPHHRNVLTTSVFALGSFALHSDANRAHILARNGIQSIIKVILQQQFDEEVNCLEICMKQMSIQEGERGPVPDGKLKGMTKAHLLKLFGTMCLMNLTENEKCRAAIIHLGGVRAVFAAAEFLHEHQRQEKSDLAFVIMYAFRKITGSQSRCYTRQSKLASLKTLAKNAVLGNLKQEFDKEKPIFSELEPFLEEQLDQLRLPVLMQQYLAKHIECRQCKTLFHGTSGITGYEVYGKEKPVLTQLCSTKCFGVFDKDSEKKKVALVDPCYAEEEFE
ncbi:hypothetical protein HDU98_007312 [Podochytrium sp. JEL0797]|nr:hypothetical protein HDU98_007312 [Podochytrium sp. JEL0797]